MKTTRLQHTNSSCFRVMPTEKAYQIDVDGAVNKLSQMNGAWARNIYNGDGEGVFVTVYDLTEKGVNQLAEMVCEVLNT